MCNFSVSQVLFRVFFRKFKISVGSVCLHDLMRKRILPMNQFKDKMVLNLGCVKQFLPSIAIGMFS